MRWSKSPDGLAAGREQEIMSGQGVARNHAGMGCDSDAACPAPGVRHQGCAGSVSDAFAPCPVWRSLMLQAALASVVKLSPQPHSAVAFGLLNVKVSLRPCLPKSITVPSTSARLLAST